MARKVTIFTGQWADLSLEDVCRKMREFGYDGLELACWGHFDVFEGAKSKGGEDDTMIVASIKIDPEEMAEVLGENYTDEDVKKELWKEVDKINDAAPGYRQIRKVILRKSDFIHKVVESAKAGAWLKLEA